MEFSKSIDSLNLSNLEEIQDIITVQQEKFDFQTSDKLIDSLFAITKECKNEELYAVVYNSNQPINVIADSTFQDIQIDSGLGRFYTNPITPFLMPNLELNQKVNLLTFRKKNSFNPKAYVLDGIERESAVFDVLSKEGLSENGKEVYLKICQYVNTMIGKSNHVLDIFQSLFHSFQTNSDNLYFLGKMDSESIISKIIFLLEYYEISSNIFCNIEDIASDGSKVKIKPIQHTVGDIHLNEKVEYEDFGEVGCFAFEMEDYK